MARQAFKLPEPLEDDELERVLEAAAASGPRDEALITVLAYAGLRVAEACRLRWDDVRSRRLFVRQGKGRKDRIVPMHARLVAVLERLRGGDQGRKRRLSRHSTGDGWVFEGYRGGHLTTRQAQRVVTRLALEAGVPRRKAHCHTLRHTIATRLLRRTKNLELVRRFLGHEKIATTQIYVHLVVDDIADGLEGLT